MDSYDPYHIGIMIWGFSDEKYIQQLKENLGAYRVNLKFYIEMVQKFHINPTFYMIL